MQRIGPEDWKQMFELLDTALDLPPGERDHWLDSLSGDYERLKPALREFTGEACEARQRRVPARHAAVHELDGHQHLAD